MNAVYAKKIMEMIKNHKITSEEGLILYKKLYIDSSQSTEGLNRQEHIRNCFDIAIIGISGRFPDAGNVNEYWENLAKGRDSVKEIPKSRWELNHFYDPDSGAINKSYSKWAGLVSHIDQFDPLFFNITPREAELMDPQQRLFLEEAYRALEDAGYSSSDLEGKMCSVFVGSVGGDYQAKLKEENVPLNAYSFIGNASSILASRISYFLGLKGPSVTIDTACSSSLVAIHLACDSIRNGTSELGIAGGVWLSVTPGFHIVASKAGMLSPEGKCKTFDQSADGFVPGEGVGVVVLKKLDEALRDGDHVYGIIKGSGINQDGKTNGVTAPSAPSQTALESEVYRKYQIHPGSISYVEAHGTGTRLGDPIEIQALTEAFRMYTDRKHYCAIGSVKTNIGHTLTAAGVAGVIKVLLSLKNKKIPPSLHFKKCNEHINFTESPFYVATELHDWEAERVTPRRAAISSFGFSGTNCHMVIEESPIPMVEESDGAKPYYMIVLSAKTEAAINRKCEDLEKWLAREVADHSIVDIAYTHHKGRSHFKVRSAFVVRDKKALIQSLRLVREHGEADNYVGPHLKIDGSKPGALLSELGNHLMEEVKTGMLSDIAYKGKLMALAELYVTGYDLDWGSLYGDLTPRRISLPTYPFERERYWIPQSEDKGESGEQLSGSVNKLHPVIDSNTSNLRELRFTTRLRDGIFYLADHVVGSQKILSGMIHLEIARAAGEIVGERKVQNLKNIVWGEPVSVNGNFVDIQINLYPQKGRVAFEVSTITENGSNRIHSQGKLFYHTNISSPQSLPAIDIEAIKLRSTLKKTEEEIYQLFKEKGLHYGRSFQVVREIFSSRTEVLSHLVLTEQEKVNCDSDQYVLRPSLMEGVLQTIIDVLNSKENKMFTFHYARAIGEVRILQPLKERCYAYLIQSDSTDKNRNNQFDVQLLDESGFLLVSINQIELESYSGAFPCKVPMDNKPEIISKRNTYFLEKVWEKELINLKKEQKIKGKILILVNKETLSLGKKIFDNEKNVSVVFLQNELQFVEFSENHFGGPFHQSKLGKELIERIKDTIGVISHLIDFSDVCVDSKKEDEKMIGKIGLYQELIKGMETELLTFLHFTRGLQSFQTKTSSLAGATMAGITKMLTAEYAKVQARTIDIDCSLNDVVGVKKIIYQELSQPLNDSEICYRNGNRYIPCMQSISSLKSGATKAFDTGLFLDSKGVIVITGGTRGIGSEVAKHFVKQGARKLVIMGIKDFPPKEEWRKILLNKDLTHVVREKIERILALEECGANIRVYSGSLTDEKTLNKYFNKIRSEMGSISGVCHCAGIANSNNLAFIRKKPEEIQAVFEPKIEGLEVLSRVFEKDNLDFFVLFSSVSSVLPALGVGMSDYAAANSFMDYFAAFQKHQGKGYYRSINWPNWKDIGMGENKNPIYRQMGFISLSTSEGMSLLDQVIQYNGPASILPCIVDETHFKRSLLLKIKHPGSKLNDFTMNTSDVKNTGTDSTKISIYTLSWLKSIFAKELKIPEKNLIETTHFGEFGIDSILLAEIGRKIEKILGVTLEPSVLFEFSTLDRLSVYLSQTFGTRLTSLSLKGETREKDIFPADVNKAQGVFENTVGVPSLKSFTKQLDSPFVEKIKVGASGNQKIAVIGIACRFPGAQDKEVFWENLIKGKNSIREIPKSRWDMESFYSPEYQKGKCMSKWGGFIDGIEDFDSSFFKLSEKEARHRDPQGRLILEESLKAILDAGYQKKDLDDKNVGVFIGARTNVKHVIQSLKDLDKNTIVGIGQNFIASNVSQFFNFRGPSLVIDTACSSSMVNIDIAAKNLQSGEIDYALAGGVNLLVDESPYLLFQERNILAPSKDFYIFDQRDHGIVLGEGVGVVLLKLLTKAIEDGDKIYAVLVSSAVNNDGQTVGTTTPNINAQKEVIEKALLKGRIDASTISYIEANGSGSEISDLLELKALNTVYRKYARENAFCALGSVKANIGHLLTASSMAGFIKVVLSLYNKKIPPFIYGEKPLDHFDIKNSPFYFNRDLLDWETHNVIRRAGISSFPDGGTNCHMILEEFQNDRLGFHYAVRASTNMPPVLNKKTLDYRENNSFWSSPDRKYKLDDNGNLRDKITTFWTVMK